MAILNVLKHPHPNLGLVARPVTEIDDSTRQLISDMFDTMYELKGVGLAATQVDYHVRIVVIDVSEHRNSPLVLVNPEITFAEGSVTEEEGCLSVPGVYELVTRAERVGIRAQDGWGKFFELEADGLLAKCVQHEIDHLNGKLFIEYLSQLKQMRIETRLLKQAKKEPIS
ncbi:MAG: peptide deformylase [Neisseriaceae bacterium]